MTNDKSNNHFEMILNKKKVTTQELDFVFNNWGELDLELNETEEIINKYTESE